MLASHVGFAVGTHFCMGHAVETKLMIGNDHLDCGIGDMDRDCKRKSDLEPYLDKVPCCENEYLSIEVEDEFNPGIDQNSFKLEFVAVFAISYINLFNTYKEKPQYSVYDPPLVPKDISILHQVFLI